MTEVWILAPDADVLYTEGEIHKVFRDVDSAKRYVEAKAVEDYGSFAWTETAWGCSYSETAWPRGYCQISYNLLRTPIMGKE